MTQQKVQFSDVVYNAANQCFEALVSVDNGSKTFRYPCSIEAPIDMSFEQATKGLMTQALRRHATRDGIHSQMHRHVATVRAGRERFDPRAWLAQLGFRSLDKAA